MTILKMNDGYLNSEELHQRTDVAEPSHNLTHCTYKKYTPPP
jgi:hypothetical protein